MSHWIASNFNQADSISQSVISNKVTRFEPEMEAFRPPPQQTVSEWADMNRVLLPGTSRQPGPWCTTATPYLKEIMNAYNDDSIRHIVFCASVQVGKTEGTIYNTLGFIIDMEPFSTLLVYPREDDAKEISRTRVQPMIRSCPTLNKRIPSKSDLFQNLEMHFPGMSLHLVGANSASALAQKPCRNVLRDEIDKYPDQIGNDADPLSLSEARARSYWDIRKIIDVSSPTVETRGIWKQLQRCDAIKEFFVPCLKCGAFQTLKFPQVTWEEGTTRDEKIVSSRKAQYKCEHCNELIISSDKQAMLSKGYWEYTKPPTGEVQMIGYRINSLYSPWLSFGDVAEAFVKAREFQKEGQLGAMQDFINGWLAEPWVQRIQVRSEDEVLAARVEIEPYTLPEGTICITAGVDIQAVGAWYVLRAWAKDYTSWLIGYGFAPGWPELEMILTQQYSGMSVWRSLVDTGGGIRADGIKQTEEVYLWVKKMRNQGFNVWGSAGARRDLAGRIHLGQAMDKTPSGRALPGGLQVISVDTRKMKDLFYWRLEQAKNRDHSAAYLHKNTDINYARQITAEEKRINKAGVEEWVEVRRDNHLLDCEVLCHASTLTELFGGLTTIRPTVKVEKEPVKKEKQDWNPFTNGRNLFG